MKMAYLKDVCDVTMGQAPPGNSYNTQNDGFPLVAGAGDLGPLNPIPKNYTTAPTRISSVGDIILCIRATIGDVNWSDIEYCLGRGVSGLSPHEDILDPLYLWYWLQASKKILSREARGSTFKQISRDAIESMRIPLPPLPEQRRIAAILDKADAIRRKRQEARRLTEEFIRSAFLEIVGPGALEYEKWPEGTIEGLALDKKNSMRTGPFGSDLRHSEFIDKGIAVLGIDNAVKNYFEWGERRFITPEKYEKLKRYKIFPGDVIITIMGTTGRSAVIPDDIPLAITTKHLAAITLNRKQAHPEFTAYAIHDHPEILHQIGRAQRGAIMNGLNLTLIKELRFRVPPLPIQEHFASIVHRVRQTLNKLSKANEYGAGDLFNSIVQRAFRGELVPTEAELARHEGRSYEPASGLLAKIKAQRKGVQHQRKCR